MANGEGITINGVVIPIKASSAKRTPAVIEHTCETLSDGSIAHKADYTKNLIAIEFEVVLSSDETGIIALTDAGVIDSKRNGTTNTFKVEHKGETYNNFKVTTVGDMQDEEMLNVKLSGN